MSGETPPACSACGSPLGPPEQEVIHPDDDDPPEDGHIKITIRDDGEERMQCRETGQLTKVLDPDDPEHPANEQETSDGEGEGSTPDREPTPEPAQDDGPMEADSGGETIFDLEEDKSQLDILAEVVSNPNYGLSDEQIQEIRAWAHDYEGQMPPDALEDIVKLMSGVQKQTAQLMRQRYELKLNKWVQKQTADTGGPLIGANRHPTSIHSAGREPNRSHQQGPSPEAMQKAQQSPSPSSSDDGPSHDGLEDSSGGGGMMSGREKRQNRRGEAISTFTNELAEGTAENLSSEAGEGMVRMRNLVLRVLESKAEKDPDWFFEVADRLDVDPIEILEASEKRKEEKRKENSGMSEVDREAREIAQQIQNEDPPQQQPSQQQQQRQPTETPNREPSNTNSQQSADAQPDRREPEVPGPENTVDTTWDDGEKRNSKEAEDEFEEIFGE